MSKMACPVCALLTGASSGIGEALALECARSGAKRLFLGGRDRGRLESVALRCREAGAETSVAAVDVADAAAMREWIESSDRIWPLEAVFANAGIGTGREDEANARRTFEVDLGGVINTAFPAIDIFRRRGDGRRQLVFTASIAGHAPLATCPAYSAAKAAVRTWGLALRGALRREGIMVNVVSPGFVRSRITDANTCPMPFFMEADRAARIIMRAVARNKGFVSFPLPMRLASGLLAALPWPLAEWIGSLLPAKNAEGRKNPA